MLFLMSLLMQNYSPTLPIPRQGTETLSLNLISSSGVKNSSPTLPIPRQGTETLIFYVFWRCQISL